MGDPRRFRAAIRQGLPLVLDAAMGTRLLTHGLDFDHDDPALWNLSHPEVILDLHRRDRAAGADVLFSNTFGAGHSSLARLGRESDLPRINTAAVKLAREAAGVHGFVLGSIGPGIGSDRGPDVREQARILIEAGVDGLVLETFRVDQALHALRVFGREGTVPIVVSLFHWPEPMDQIAKSLLDLGAEGLGVNCGVGPESAVEATERYFREQKGVWLVKPSAGIPGGPITTPEDFATMAQRFRALGACMIGGCCGTTEAHIAAMRRAMDAQATGPETRG